jgi:hypothetical protein
MSKIPKVFPDFNVLAKDVGIIGFPLMVTNIDLSRNVRGAGNGTSLLLCG